MTGGTGTRVVLEEIDVKKVIPVDSAVIGSSGFFSFEINTEQAGFYRLSFADEKSLILVVKPGDRIEVKADLQEFPGGVELKGSAESTLLLEFMKASEKNKKEADSIQEMLVLHTSLPDFASLTEASVPAFSNIFHRQEMLEKEFLASHSDLLASLIVLNYGFGPRAVLPIDEHLALYLHLDSSLTAAYPGNKHVLYHHKRILGVQSMENEKKR